MYQKLAVSTQGALLTTLVGLIDGGAAGGTIKIYTGSPPADVETTATGTLLAVIVLPKPSATIVSGVGIGADPDPVNAIDTGTAGWFRLENSDGGRVLDGDVSGTDGDGLLKLSSTSLTEGAPVDIAQINLTAA